MCFLEKKRAENHMACVFQKKSERENTNWKLIAQSRSEKCVFYRRSEQKTTWRVFFRGKASKKTHSKQIAPSETASK